MDGNVYADRGEGFGGLVAAMAAGKACREAAELAAVREAAAAATDVGACLGGMTFWRRYGDPLAREALAAWKARFDALLHGRGARRRAGA